MKCRFKIKNIKYLTVLLIFIWQSFIFMFGNCLVHAATTNQNNYIALENGTTLTLNGNTYSYDGDTNVTDALLPSNAVIQITRAIGTTIYIKSNTTIANLDIVGGGVSIQGGILTIDSSSDTGATSAFSAGEVKVLGATLNVIGNSNTGNDGIDASQLEVKSGTVSASGGNAGIHTVKSLLVGDVENKTSAIVNVSGTSGVVAGGSVIISQGSTITSKASSNPEETGSIVANSIQADSSSVVNEIYTNSPITINNAYSHKIENVSDVNNFQWTPSSDVVSNESGKLTAKVNSVENITGISTTDSGIQGGAEHKIIFNANLVILSQFNVIFDDYDGSQIGKTQTITSGSIKAPVDPTRNGYIFKGWSSDDGKTILSDDQINAMNITSSLTYVAQYVSNSNKVTFMDEDGVTQIGIIQVIETGGYTTAPNDLVKQGYTFMGWSSDGGKTVFTSEEINKKKVTSDITYVAQFSVSINTIKFMDYDGITQIGNTQIIEQGNKAVIPPDPTRDGYSFVGWSTDGGATIVSSSELDTSSVQGKVVYVAQYKADSNSVKFMDYDGVTQIGETQTVDTEYSPNAPNNPSREGYTFVGWSADNGSTILSSGEINGCELDKNTIYVAQYIKGGVNIEFMDYDGKNQIGNTQVLEQGKPIVAPENAVRTGYIFIGWSKSGSDKIISNTNMNKIPAISDTTYIAKYKSRTNLIKFVDNAGTTILSEKVDSGQKINIPSNTTVNGQKIMGWGSGQEILTTKQLGEKTSNGDITYIAEYVTGSNIVVFMDYDGITQIGKTQIVPQNNKATFETDPIRKGYSFIGWSSDEGKTILKDKDIESNIVSQDTIYTAQYKKLSGNLPKTGYGFIFIIAFLILISGLLIKYLQVKLPKINRN